MTSAFSTNDTECLGRNTEHEIDIGSIDVVWDEKRLNDCADWIHKHKFGKVCLQFPDDLIRYSVQILNDLKKNTSAVLCILGDTSYGSCCVDEVAASHVDADAVIHFGHACLSKLSRLPVHYVFANFDLDALSLSDEVRESIPDTDEKILVFHSTGFFYRFDSIKSAFSSYPNASFAQLALDSAPDILCWKLPEGTVTNSVCLWIGEENQSFFNASLSINAKRWMVYDPRSKHFHEVTCPLTTNWMRRRNFFVEKCKDAQSIGIVVGTLAADGYLDVVKRIQTLARNRGIRSYLLSVGKINPAKLANFMEIECFVFVGCPENNIYTSRDFYTPLVSVFEAELALNPAWREQYPNFYSVDFKEILPNGKHHRETERNGSSSDNKDYDVSLVSGRVRSMKVTTADDSNTNTETQIERKNNQLMQTNSSAAFNDRSWTGLNPKLGQDEPSKISKGRSGIPIKYTEDNH